MSSAVGQRGWSAQSKTHWVTAAVMIYNVLARSTAQYRALLGDASAQVIKLVPRSPQRFFTPFRGPPPRDRRSFEHPVLECGVALEFCDRELAAHTPRVEDEAIGRVRLYANPLRCGPPLSSSVLLRRLLAHCLLV